MKTFANPGGKLSDMNPEGRPPRVTEELALTFDDVLLVPGYSEVHPRDVDTSTQLTRDITLNIPIVSAAMDTVTESALAIAIAQEGGIGIIHKNLPMLEQVEEVDRVKRSESGMIVNPITLPPDVPISRARELMDKFRISGVPITDGKRLVGILTNRDLRFVSGADLKVKDVMTKENLITAPVGTTLEEAERILHKHRIEKLPVVDQSFNLRGLITVKDIQKRIRYPRACKDHLGRLRVGAAIGVGEDNLDRADELVRAGVDVIVVDSAHGHSKAVLETTRAMKRKHAEHAAHRGERGDRRRNARSHRGRRRLREGWDGARLRLHHARRRGRRRAADFSRARMRGGRGARRTSRSSPTAASSTRATS